MNEVSFPTPRDDNPFIALGVATRELSYSQVVAHHVLTHPPAVKALLAQLCPHWGEVRLVDVPITEHNLGAFGRVDIFATFQSPKDARPRTLLVESKFNALLDEDQLKRYSEALRQSLASESKSWEAGDVVLVPMKLVPMANRVALVSPPEGDLVRLSQVLDAKILLDCLNDHNPVGLAEMLRFLVGAEAQLRENPLAVKKHGNDAAKALIQRLMPGAVDDFVFANFLSALNAIPQGQAPTLQGGLSTTSRGGRILKFNEEAWYREDHGVQVHFELKDYGKLALHVEVAPYSNKPCPEALQRKNKWVVLLREHLASLDASGWKVTGTRKEWEQHASTTLGGLRIDWEAPAESVAAFVVAYRQVGELLTKAGWPLV